MAYRIKLKIKPSINKDLKIYIYRSKNQEDIESIGKIKNLLPIVVLDETTYPTEMMEDGQYVIYDTPVTSNKVAYSYEKENNVFYDTEPAIYYTSANPGTVEYNGPQPTSIPTNEYETVYTHKKMNQYTGYATITLNPLPLEYAGTLYYYSIIGVDTNKSLITHLSRVKAEVLKSDYIKKGTREIQFCNNYNGLPTDIWETLTTADWDTNIILGDVLDSVSYIRFGSPFVDEIKIFETKDITIDTRCVINFNHITLTIPNIWQMDNQKYNYRKLKSFKIRNIYDDHYGDWSVPTYPSILPVSIEKMIILREEVTGLTTEKQKEPISLDKINDTLVYTIIRRNGKFYTQEDVTLSYNRYTLNENENNKAVYSENSVQPEIVFNFNAKGNTVYNYTFYLEDIYGKYSAPTVAIVEC